MNSQELRETLEELKRELARPEQFDVPTRESLEQLSEEIDRRLASETKEALETPAEEPSFTEQLQSYLLEIETEHPKLTRAVNQVAAALANLGI
ncbi:MAG: DUF4404 family protein [Lacipirellulaceae bacterium]